MFVHSIDILHKSSPELRRTYATVVLDKMELTGARAVADQRRRSIGVIVGGEVDEDSLLLSGLAAPILLVAEREDRHDSLLVELGDDLVVPPTALPLRFLLPRTACKKRGQNGVRLRWGRKSSGQMTQLLARTGSASNSRFSARRAGSSSGSLFTGMRSGVRELNPPAELHAPEELPAAEELPAPEGRHACLRSYSSVSWWSSKGSSPRLRFVYFFAARFLMPSALTHRCRSGSLLLPERQHELHIARRMVECGGGFESPTARN